MEELQSFTMTNLARYICKTVKMPHTKVFQELKKYVQPRLEYMNGTSRSIGVYFFFEESYVEPEWKEMIAQHYLNTSYRVNNTVMRVHLLLTNKLSEVNEKSYVGCFTLRHIDEVRIMLSFIYPNWEIVSHKEKLPCVMSYLKKVHIEGKEVAYHTYPLFVQDNALLGCAQACLVSMSKYLNEKYRYNKIAISSMAKAVHYHKVKLIPTGGLKPLQMLEVLDYHNIPVRFNVFAEDSDVDDFVQIIDCTIESALPVLLGTMVRDDKDNVSNHVIQIIGHSGEGLQRQYMVYDDSGFYLKSIGNNGFVGMISEKQLREALTTDQSCIIYPIHERAYLLYDNIKNRLRYLFEKMPVLQGLKQEGVCDERNARCFLVDNREVKKFIIQNIRDNEKIPMRFREEATKILCLDAPHYLWYCEIKTNNQYIVFLADPTFNRSTTKSIFLNNIPLIVEKQLGLLNYKM